MGGGSRPLIPYCGTVNICVNKVWEKDGGPGVFTRSSIGEYLLFFVEEKSVDMEIANIDFNLYFANI